MNTAKTVSRRQFLNILAVSGTALGAGIALDRFGACGDRAVSGGVMREAQVLMGMVVNLTLVGAGELAQPAANAALDDMRRLTGIFSRFEANSQLAQLNTNGVLYDPAPELVAVVGQAQALSAASNGAFDVTVQPLLDVYQSAYQGGELPAAAEIDQTLALVGAANVCCNDQEIRFARAGMCMTLDGIAKGAVIDAGVAVLQANGFANVLVEVGGDLLAAGTHTLEQPWRIGLRAPRSEQVSTMPTLHIQNRAVATSGDYLQAFSADYTNHHIIDPRCGVSSPELASVTVIAPTAMLADALATAIMVAGAEDGLALLEHYPGCEAYMIDKMLNVTVSSGMAVYLA